MRNIPQWVAFIFMTTSHAQSMNHISQKKSVVAPKGLHVKIDHPLTGPQLIY